MCGCDSRSLCACLHIPVAGIWTYPLQPYARALTCLSFGLLILYSFLHLHEMHAIFLGISTCVWWFLSCLCEMYLVNKPCIFTGFCMVDALHFVIYHKGFHAKLYFGPICFSIHIYKTDIFMPSYYYEFYTPFDAWFIFPYHLQICWGGVNLG